VTAHALGQPGEPPAGGTLRHYHRDIETSGAQTVADVLRSGRPACQVIDLFGDGSRVHHIDMRRIRPCRQCHCRFSSTAAAEQSRHRPPRLDSVSLKDVERIEILQASPARCTATRPSAASSTSSTPEAAHFALDVDAGLGSYRAQHATLNWASVSADFVSRLRRQPGGRQLSPQHTTTRTKTCWVASAMNMAAVRLL